MKNYFLSLLRGSAAVTALILLTCGGAADGKTSPDVTTPASVTTLYLRVWSWPQDGKLQVTGLQGDIAKADLLKANALGWHKHLATPHGADGVTIKVPSRAPDTMASTIVLKLKSVPSLN